MKRYILTSLCTLGLSLLGAFGINQNNSADELSTISNTSNVNQYNAAGEELQNLPADNITPNAENAVEDNTKDNTEAVTPAKSISAGNAGENASVSSNEGISQAAAEQKDTQQKTEETTKATENTALKNDSVAKEPAEEKKSETETVTKTAAPVKQTQDLTATAKKNYPTNDTSDNTPVTVYKNIDLSQCKSVNEVVIKLQKCGYTNITSSNIQNISSLKDFLNQLPNGGYSNNTGNAAKPTQAPAAEPTKAPTEKPTQAPTAKPTQAPKPTTKPSSDSSEISNYANQVLQLVNQERAKAGLSALTTNSTLTAAANKRAQETVQSFSHTRPNGSSFSSVLKEYNISYRTSGENIAYGQRSPQEVVNGWMNSPGHRANILNANFNKIGIGVYQSNGVIYWTQLFTN